MPTVGPGALSPDIGEGHLQGTSKESVLFKPRDIVWNNIGEECAQDAVGVSFFLGMSRPIDVGSIGVISP
jgi:protein transport protein SEC24